MGYRFYFYAVPKSLVKKIEKCETNNALVSLPELQKVVETCDNEKWVSLWNIGKEVYEFGKEIDFFDEIEKCKDLFKPELYNDYNAKVCTQATFKVAIESYANRIKGLYEDLLREESSSPYEKGMTQIERFKEYAEDHLLEWNRDYVTPYNIDLENSSICHSWRYEYAIFELVRCYKTFDWENDDLIFLGW